MSSADASEWSISAQASGFDDGQGVDLGSRLSMAQGCSGVSTPSPEVLKLCGNNFLF